MDRTAADFVILLIEAIKQYNSYRGNFVPSLVGSMIGRFPAHIDYYEGQVKELDIEKLNPQKQGAKAAG